MFRLNAKDLRPEASQPRELTAAEIAHVAGGDGTPPASQTPPIGGPTTDTRVYIDRIYRK